MQQGAARRDESGTRNIRKIALLHGLAMFGTAQFRWLLKRFCIFAEQINALFTVAVRRAGLNRERSSLSTANFRRPGEQMTLL